MTNIVNFIPYSRCWVFGLLCLSLSGCFSAEMAWDTSSVDIVSYSLANIPKGAKVWIKMAPVSYAGECLPVELGFADSANVPFSVSVDSNLILYTNNGGGGGSGADVMPAADPSCTVPLFDHQSPGDPKLVLKSNEKSYKFYGRFSGIGVFTLNAYTNTFTATPGVASTLITIQDAPSALTLIAGPDSPRGKVDGTGSAARFNAPAGIAFDSNTNSDLYVIEKANRLLRRVSIPTGTVTTLAGGGNQRWGELSDGAPGQGWFNYPTAAVFVPSAGGYANSVYVLDNGSIRRVDSATGMITTIAGDPYQSGDSDGAGNAARFGYGEYLAYSATQNSLYISDRNASPAKIKAISIDFGTYGQVTTIATSGGYNFSPGPLAVWNSNLLFFNQIGNTWAHMPLPGGAVTNISGGASATPCNAATFYMTSNLLLSYCGSAVKFSNYNGSTLGAVSNMAGDIATGLNGGLDNGTGSQARLSSNITGIVAKENDGTFLYVADVGNHSVRAISSSGPYATTTLAGPSNLVTVVTPTMGNRIATTFHYPRSVAVTNGALYVASAQMLKIQMIKPNAAAADPTGVTPWDLSGTFNNIEAIAADASNICVAGVLTSSNRRIQCYSPGSPGTDPTLNSTYTTNMSTASYQGTSFRSLVVMGNIAFATHDNDHQIIRYDLGVSGGNWTAIGNGANGYVNGTGSVPLFSYPGALATDGTSVFIADTGNHVIRRLDPTTLDVTTFSGFQFVGNSGGGGQSDDGPAVSARFDQIGALAVNGSYLYVAETYRHRIRRVSLSSGDAMTLLGGYDQVNDGVGAFGSFGVSNPTALASDVVNGLYIANDFNIRALK